MDLPTEAQATAILSAHEAVLALEWGRCEPWLAAALEHDGGFFEIADVRDAVFGGRAHLWAGVRAAAVSRWVEYDTGKTLLIWVAGGDLDELTNRMLPAGEDWARERGCTRALLYGRRGWERVLAPRGFRHHSTLLLKEFG